jgi:predicted DNA-binding transcriptional regulator AlpA
MKNEDNEEQSCESSTKVDSNLHSKEELWIANKGVVAMNNEQVAKNSLPDTGFVRLPGVLAVIPISKSSWWAGVKVGKYPAPVKLSSRITCWRVQDIKDLIARLSQ